MSSGLNQDQDRHTVGPGLSVKRFEPRSRQSYCWSWSGFKLFANVINRKLLLPLALKEFRYFVIYMYLYILLVMMIWRGLAILQGCTCLKMKEALIGIKIYSTTEVDPSMTFLIEEDSKSLLYIYFENLDILCYHLGCLSIHLSVHLSI